MLRRCGSSRLAVVLYPANGLVGFCEMDCGIQIANVCAGLVAAHGRQVRRTAVRACYGCAEMGGSDSWYIDGAVLDCFDCA